jgi:hypothetical protein
LYFGVFSALGGCKLQNCFHNKNCCCVLTYTLKIDTLRVIIVSYD